MSEFSLFVIVTVILFLLVKNSNLLQDKTRVNKEVVDALEKLCNLGDAESCRKLAEQYYPGNKEDKSSINQYIFYLDKSANLGDNLSCNWLGDFYREGQYVNKDLKESIRYYNMGVEFGNTPHYCEAKLGHLYFIGDGVKQNFVKSASLIKKACNEETHTTCFEIFKERKHNLNDSQVLLDELLVKHNCTYCPALAQLDPSLSKKKMKKTS